MSFSIGKTLGKLITGVKETAETLEGDVSREVQKLAHDVDVFDQGVVKPLLNSGRSTPASVEPAVYAGDGGLVSYGPSVGKLAVNGVQATDVEQGALGDCYFMASLAAVANSHPELIQNAITTKPDGSYDVQFHEVPGVSELRVLGMAGAGALGYVERAAEKLGLQASATRSVSVDGAMPQVAGYQVYGSDPDPSEVWPQVMEKAFAKYFGSYTAIGVGGDPGTALTALTGAPTDRVKTSAPIDALWSAIASASAAGQPAVATTGGKVPDTDAGLVTDHAYTVLGTRVDGGQRYVELRNPWGEQAPVNSVGDGQDDGIFAMTIEDFAKGFTGVEIART